VHPGQDLNALYAPSVERVQAAYRAALRPREDVVKMLDEVKQTGRPVMMYTDGGPAHTVEKLEASGLGKYFDTVYTGADHPFEDIASAQTKSSSIWDKLETVGENPKSTTSGFEQIIARRNLNPSRTLMTGDHALEDVTRAKQVGMRSALARYYSNSFTSLPSGVTPDLVLNSPGDLTAKLKLPTFARSA
jgi:FMN phosphatase YigB (HAD superfamily)